MGLVGFAGTELEFIVYNDTYEDGLGPALPRPDAGQPVQRRLLADRDQPGRAAASRHPQPHVRRRATVESAKGECNLGQHEIAFKYDEVVRTADQHSVYKTAAKEIACQHGKSITFMAKFDEREGNSCHVHMSLRGLDGEIVFDEGDGADAVCSSTSWPACRRRWRDFTLVLCAEHQLLQALPAGVVRADGHRLGS